MVLEPSKKGEERQRVQHLSYPPLTPSTVIISNLSPSPPFQT